MQCPSCQFENMPGSGRCARCGGMLALASVAIDVHPPRAGRMARRAPRLWSRFWAFRQWWGNFSSAATRPLNEIFARFEDTNFTAETMLRTIVPGWAHRYRGNPQRGAIFFFGYLALLLPGITFMGTALGSLLLGFALTLHITSAADALVSRFATFGDRLAFLFACAIGLSLVLYLPAGLLVSRIAVPIHINQAIQQFAEGDVVWYHPTRNVSPGDFVLYQVPEMTINGNHTRYFFRNRWINRVEAMAGQRVSIKDGKLSIDGKPNPRQPMMGLSGGIEMDFVVPDGQVFISPDSLATLAPNLNRDQWQRLSLISRDRIDGRLFFRSQPLWRISRISGAE